MPHIATSFWDSRQCFYYPTSQQILYHIKLYTWVHKNIGEKYTVGTTFAQNFNKSRCGCLLEMPKCLTLQPKFGIVDDVFIIQHLRQYCSTSSYVHGCTKILEKKIKLVPPLLKFSTSPWCGSLLEMLECPTLQPDFGIVDDDFIIQHLHQYCSTSSYVCGCTKILKKKIQLVLPLRKFSTIPGAVLCLKCPNAPHCNLISG